MKKLFALIALLFAVGAFAQAPAPARVEKKTAKPAKHVTHTHHSAKKSSKKKVKASAA